MNLAPSLPCMTPSSSGSAPKRRRFPSARPRTGDAFDCLGGAPYRNRRSVKRGPGGGAWEVAYAELTGPPPAELRDSELHCWLCNAALRVRRRQWTRPAWRRCVTTTHVPRSPCKKRPPHKEGWQVAYLKNAQGLVTKVLYDKVVTEPPSRLPMEIYFCPNGCDADGSLKSLLASKDHTGPAQARRVPGGDWYEPTQ